MPGPQLTPFVSDPDLPPRVDVVVIGGGIVGTSTALELAERGLSVLLCEKGEIGGEQSSRNWGWVRLSMRDPREIPLMIEALRLWEGLDARVGGATGYRRAGILFTAADTKTFRQQERWAENLRPYQIEARMVSGADLDGLLPGRQIGLKGALHTPLDGRAEPQWAAPAVAEGARAAGAAVLTGCAVRAVDLAAGRISGVFTERGRVACEAVVLAGGAWSRLFAGNAGIALPQLKLLNTVMRTSAVEGGPEVSVWADRFALRKRADGGYTVASGVENTCDLVPDSFRLMRAFLPALFHEWSSLSFRLSGRWREEARMPRRWAPGDVTPFETCRVLDPAPSEKVLKSCWAEAQRAFPLLQGAQMLQSWGGMIDVTPDAVPVISAVEGMAGMHIATGFSGHGFGIGPGAGRLMADLVTGAAPVVDPTPFRLSRFSDGSRVTLDKGF
ncbi:NAD(P)/FAD-dependent oxidoreductase [Pseudodonghicola flavimaris]|uniref:FAD-binding oxidoreductase n=1 Tax=Pseudodonghicola flavimaris TaxID=3050036 RepID=A0ABT7F5C2_9RHOB|nr:FAD-binding oxidoreductase [Pseudodonghicola flavimaris]MDK3019604.1 FAD-binding oxidoreductase [Pseudodonghicola flavimaris]